MFDDETSSGSKSAQGLDYNYDCERFFLVLSVISFLLVADSPTKRHWRMFHPDPTNQCVDG